MISRVAGRWPYQRRVRIQLTDAGIKVLIGNPADPYATIWADDMVTARRETELALERYAAEQGASR